MLSYIHMETNCMFSEFLFPKCSEQICSSSQPNAALIHFVFIGRYEANEIVYAQKSSLFSERRHTTRGVVATARAVLRGLAPVLARWPLQFVSFLGVIISAIAWKKWQAPSLIEEDGAATVTQLKEQATSHNVIDSVTPATPQAQEEREQNQRSPDL